MPLMREDQYRILVSVDGVALDNTPWQVYEGGDIQASNTNTRPGNMQPAVDLGGPASRTDVTVRRVYSNDVLHPLILPLEAACGKKKFTVSYTPLDADGNPNGQTIVETGVLKEVQHPNYDANANAAATLTLISGMNEQASAAGN